MIKKFIALLTVFSVLFVNTVGVFAQENNTVKVLNQYGKSPIHVETLTIENEDYTYKSQENATTRQVDVYDENNVKISTVVYDKNAEKLFVDGNEVEVDIETSTENTFSELDNSNKFSLDALELRSIGPWKKFGSVKKYKYNIKANLSAAIAIAGIASLVGGPVGAFLGMWSVWQGSKTNCSVKKITYSRQYGSKTQLKYVAKVYWGRNFEEYFYTANWMSSPK
ncbi:hypothetical protein L0P54_11160 [Anaerosalibacter bizertensis]|uniref:Uncharacterized protein n=1 Tax=Anaerosalibacter bizertensis TaxID=932217 RepID=A0A9Q4FLT0_9FIRM|nr:hypothetical protein [Anaerosalibacter bizertensis]MBV1821042.1 hypothetical protein [Bacteroidales bacterium MSK.15.36]MCB5560632.1 hypothetical protein [Anaerosalibacter bizertensis]MCG4566091.1 hypothetical protein [Anaerosalibacter bizertensis]MCG4583548.1 hypothetical protein [Anaerosalibacter bizertensis]MCG4585898.1 hypothetical protein [Anaerosalibacter bizertensis]